MKATITIGNGIAVSVVKWKHLKRAFEAVLEEERGWRDDLDKKLGLLAEYIAIELRGWEYEVNIAVMPGFRLRHGCGKEWDPAEFARLPAKRQRIYMLGKLQTYSFYEQRKCTCDSTVSYALELVPAEPVVSPEAGPAPTVLDAAIKDSASKVGN